MTRDADATYHVPLTREAVVHAAVALADMWGVESLTIRKLAHELGAAPMALYRHIANKDELLDGMVDVVFGEIEVPTDAENWKRVLRQRGISARKALLRHPWAIGLMESRLSPGSASLKHHNAVLGTLRDAGFSFKAAVHAYSVLDSYMYGFALQEKSLPFETPEESAEVAKATVGSYAGEYPYLAEVVTEFGKSGYDYAEEFESGLDLILDGIERLRSDE